MNILVLSWRDPRHPLSGGAEQVMHEHMKGWISAGHQVTLFSSKMRGLAKVENLDGVTIIRGGYQYWGVQFAAFFYYLKNHQNFDFVVDQFHGIPFFTPVYINKPKLAVIQEPAKKVWLLNPLPWPMNWIIGIIGFLGEPLIFLLFYRSMPFMTGSQTAKEDVHQMGIPEKNITVIPHGVIIPRIKNKRPREKIKTVVYLGILSKDKGIEEALKCFKILDNKGKFQFWVIGKPETKDYGDKIKKITKDLVLKNKVKFWGFVSQGKKFELLSRAHLLINPSHREGWGLVNIEANYMGTPVVAYNNVGLRDSVKDRISGILCKDNTPENLTENVIKLLNNKKLYQQLQKGAISWSKNFSWGKSRKLSLNLLEKLI